MDLVLAVIRRVGDHSAMPNPMSAAVAIQRVEAIHVRVPFRRPLLDATGEYTHRRVWLLRVTDLAGNEGLGEAALSPTADEAATNGLAALVRDVGPRLVDGAVDEADLAAQGEPGRALLAAMEGAMGALRAKPGGEVEVAATIGFGGADAGGEAAAQSIELGFRTLELRAGFERETRHLVDRLRAIRAAVGPEPSLRVDAGGAWDLDTAVERLRGIEPYRVEYVAQPLPAWDIAGHAALRERVPGVAVALDEAVTSEGAGRAALAEGAASVLVLRPARLGGEAPSLRLVAAAAQRGAGVVIGSFFETGVGIAAGLRIAAAVDAAAPGRGRTVHALATAGVLTHDLLATPLAIEHGRMRVPGRISLDEQEVRRLTLERFEATRA